MQFCEANELWRDIPEWVRFLIAFGYAWIGRDRASRQIALISMPCDSAAAGLVALGAMRRYLEYSDANDKSQHFQRIRKGIGRYLRRRNWPLKKYKLVDCERDNALRVALVPPKRNDFITIYERIACEWRFEDEPFVEDIEGKELRYGPVYRELIDQGGEIQKNNLYRTHSGVCLAGRVMGESKTREIMATVKFRPDDGESAGLDQLLSIHDWASQNISRVSFFNPRTGKRDREAAPPSVVVPDGDGAFLTVLHNQLFDQSDIIATIDRTLDRQRTEALVQKMASISQWYAREETLPNELPPVPRGVSVAMWTKR